MDKLWTIKNKTQTEENITIDFTMYKMMYKIFNRNKGVKRLIKKN